jgi:cation:H+ antiporter
LLPALGLLLTPWKPTPDVAMGIFITLLSVLWLRINAFGKKGIRIRSLMLCGVFYATYLWSVLGR